MADEEIKRLRDKKDVVYDLDDIVAELADGMYVIPSDGKSCNFNLKAVMKKLEELGRPLTDEEFEKFIIHNDE